MCSSQCNIILLLELYYHEGALLVCRAPIPLLCLHLEGGCGPWPLYCAPFTLTKAEHLGIPSSSLRSLQQLPIADRSGSESCSMWLAAHPKIRRARSARLQMSGFAVYEVMPGTSEGEHCVPSITMPFPSRALLHTSSFSPKKMEPDSPVSNRWLLRCLSMIRVVGNT